MSQQHSIPDGQQDAVAVAEAFGSTDNPWHDPPLARTTASPRPAPGPGHGRAAAAPQGAAASAADDLGQDGRWSIGNAGRAFTEVEPVLGQAAEGPDTMADGGTVGAVHLLAASVRGLSHRQNGGPRQDSYGFAVTQNGRWLIAVVADGVSAGRLSHRAAQLVARHAPARVLEELEEVDHGVRVDWYRVFTWLATRIVTVGQKMLADEGTVNPTPKDVCDAMATTATIAVVEISPAPDQDRYMTYAWMGDSPIWRIDPANNWHCMTEVKNAGQEVAKSSVHALPRLPDDPAKLPQGCGSIPGDARLLLMSDGVGDPLGPADGEVAEALAQAWRTPPSVFRFAEQVAFGRKSYDDDRTVVAIWPRT
ncbi:protein phosphatase 2C domain-containing protein [Luedemannella helvata]|uniref:PPM-type phosphatase domain-containing protein n=1 Tax=Luedemannella helvata TaxID=349315 RepID=A0ABP4VZQ5_9ACTN